MGQMFGGLLSRERSWKQVGGGPEGSSVTAASPSFAGSLAAAAALEEYEEAQAQRLAAAAGDASPAAVSPLHSRQQSGDAAQRVDVSEPRSQAGSFVGAGSFTGLGGALSSASRHILWADAAMASESEDTDGSVAGGSDVEKPLLGAKHSRSSTKKSRQLEDVVNADEADPARCTEVFSRGVVSGLINSILLCPTIVSFASVVFRETRYAEFIPMLVRLMFFSGFIHQFVITCGSSMRFAVGQVQDVGLVVLSAIASEVAREAGEGELTDHEKRSMTATTLAFLAIATAGVGAMLYVTGRCGLASLAQCCPLPVVGGYLGYVGYFCLSSGATLATGMDLGANPAAWWHAISDGPSAARLALCFGSALLYMATNRLPPWLQSSLALPLVLLVIPAAFYAVVLGGGHSLDDARAGGWMSDAPAGSEPFYDVWSTLYGVSSLGDIHWSLFPKLVLTKIVVLFFLVAFGSSLDVAAIQADYSDRLDYNKELRMVGLSNLCAGLAGSGFTGSYIFSMTLFNLQSGVRNRVCGIVIMIGNLTFFLLPISLVNYLPSFFLGSLLVFFGIEIIIDWLIYSVRRIGAADYVMLLITFACTLLTNVEYGVIIGLAISAAQFIYLYGRASTPIVEDISSDVEARHMGDTSARSLVEHMVKVVRLDGYLFFGAALSAVNTALAAAQEMGPGSFVLLDLSNVVGLDATSAHSLSQLAHNIERGGSALVICGTPRRAAGGGKRLLSTLQRHGLHNGEALPSVEACLLQAEAVVLERAAKVGAYRPPPHM